MAFPQKGALKEGTTIVFCDQSGFYLLPGVVGTYAPVGQTPILMEHFSRDHLSAMSAITLEGKLYILEQERAFKAEDTVRFLKHLMHQIPGKLLVVSGMALRYIADGPSKISSPARQLLGLNWSNCPSLRTRSQGPEEGIWKHLKCVELKNLCCQSLSELKVELRKAKERLRH